MYMKFSHVVIILPFIVIRKTSMVSSIDLFASLLSKDFYAKSPNCSLNFIERPVSLSNIVSVTILARLR
jgi:hypothetical protein